ncbi:MAG: hypothetical protein JNM67_08855 [Bacteroidetes bacterium]|nr:hypothetical protein [Bacteroidota bacterium]
MNTTTTSKAIVPVIRISNSGQSLKIDYRGTYYALRAIELIKKLTAALPF